ncbi:MAG TPA: hypothetical protein VHG29_02460 [Novosphingobium sp.]|nr:hypothetical protein [Novosphingobium sp.]
MKYAIIALLAAAGFVWWLNSPDGQRTKQRLIESRDRSVQMYEREE